MKALSYNCMKTFQLEDCASFHRGRNLSHCLLTRVREGILILPH